MTSAFFISLAIALAVSALFSVGWFLASLQRNRNDVADEAWPTYFAAIALVLFALNNPFLDFRFIPLVIVGIWAWRLFRHISKRHREHGEDARYVIWRNAWERKGTRYFRVRSFLQVFLLQALLATVVALPVVVMQTFGADDAFLVPFIIGLVIWISGFVLEKRADKQLKAFLANRDERGPQVMKTGVWKYSRHPNYFGEALQWWGLWTMTIGLPFWWLAILGPLTITYLLRFVSGVPLAERSMEGIPEFEAYKAKTNAFVPWIRKIRILSGN